MSGKLVAAVAAMEQLSRPLDDGTIRKLDVGPFIPALQNSTPLTPSAAVNALVSLVARYRSTRAANAPVGSRSPRSQRATVPGARSRRYGWPLTKRAALDGESEKAEPSPRWRGKPGGVRPVDLTSGERRFPPHIGYCRVLGLVGRQPEGGDYS
jgi:hypothetical protein